MKCIILAAGRGTRMGSLTDSTPKPMIELLGRPKLAYTIDNLPDVVTEVILVVGYLQETIREYFGTQYDGRTISYVKQAELNGSGGALMLCCDHINSPTMVINGDDLYLSADLEKLSQQDCAMLTLYSTEIQRYGAMAVDEYSRVRGIKESPHQFDAGLVNCGAYMVPQNICEQELIYHSEVEAGIPLLLIHNYVDTGVVSVAAHAWQAVGMPDDIPIAEEFIRQYYHRRG